MKKTGRYSAVSAIICGLLVLAGCGVGTAASTGTPGATPTLSSAALNPCLAQSSEIPAASVPASAAAPAHDDLAALSDDFGSAATLAGWQNLSTVEGWPSQIQTMNVNATSPGALYLVPYTSTWFEDYHGVFLYKEISGDFMVTTRLKTTGKHGAVPESAFSLAGVMARAPRDGLTPATWTSGHENWVFITTGVGHATDGEPQIETKTTVNSVSDLRLIPSVSDWLDLRIVRIGHTFVMLYRLPGQSWTLSRCFDRPDLPQRLQVGLNAYTDWLPIDNQYHYHQGDFNRTLLTGAQTHPDLIVRYDSIHFTRQTVPDAVRAQIANGRLALNAWLPFVTR